MKGIICDRCGATITPNKTFYKIYVFKDIVASKSIPFNTAYFEICPNCEEKIIKYCKAPAAE